VAELRASPGRKIVFIGPCVVEDGAVIIADTADCVISHSHISAGARVRNSSVHAVHAGAGSQILETTMVFPEDGENRDEGYCLTLEPGFGFDGDNFAFSRGAVVKRIQGLSVPAPITVPTGHSLIGSEEFERLIERNGRFEPRAVFDGRYFCINAQYAHPESYERFYDPGRFGVRFLPQGTSVEAVPGEIGVDLLRLRRARAAGDPGWQSQIEAIHRASLSSARMVFVDSERGAILLEKE
jgi:hypothetical protein